MCRSKACDDLYARKLTNYQAPATQPGFSFDSQFELVVFQNLVIQTDSSFFRLNPDLIMQATERAGLLPTGEFRQLNSFENRVYDVALEDHSRVILKFYRPGRWSQAQILEEHSFLEELTQDDFPVVNAMSVSQQKTSRTLIDVEGMWVAFFPKKMARMPDELLPADIPLVARKLAELHRIASHKSFRHRLRFAEDWSANLDENLRAVVPELRSRYSLVCEELEEFVLELGHFPQQRLHGDLHRGNLLFDGREFFFVDFDDCLTGPKMQDVWMLWLAFNEEERQAFQEAYSQMGEFPAEQLPYVPAFQAVRLAGYSSWIHRRWEDPSFPALFPNFGTYNYWAEETEALEKCLNWMQRGSSGIG